MEKCAQCASQSSLRRCTGCFDIWYCSRDCQTKHWNQHRTTCSTNTHRTVEKEAMVSEEINPLTATEDAARLNNRTRNYGATESSVAGRDRCSHCGSRCPKLRRCMGCLAAWYCSTECQGQHWPEHRNQCSTSKGRESKGKRTVETCVQCASQSNLRRCKGCLKVWYCSKECQKQHWGLHKGDCKKKAKNEKETLGDGEADSDNGTSSEDGASANDEDWSRVGEFLCQNCGHRRAGMRTCDRCQQPTHILVTQGPGMHRFVVPFLPEPNFLHHIYDLAGGPIHSPVDTFQRKERRSTEERRLAEQRKENCRLSNQQDGVYVTPILTWEEARLRATLLFPEKRIVDKFCDLGIDLLLVPPCMDVVSISRIGGVYELASILRVARRLKDSEEKGSFVIFHNSEDPMPFFRYEQLSVGNFLCLDHAHLHKFVDGTIGFRVDYPWDVLVLEP